MRLEGTVTQDGKGARHTGVGQFIAVGKLIWIFYSIDLSDEGTYVGYMVSPDGVSYHVRSILQLDNKVHFFIRKIRKDRGMTRPAGTIISITDTHITIDTGKKHDAWCLRTEGCGIENYRVGDVAQVFIQDNRAIKVIDTK